VTATIPTLSKHTTSVTQMPTERDPVAQVVDCSVGWRTWCDSCRSRRLLKKRSSPSRLAAMYRPMLSRADTYTHVTTMHRLVNVTYSRRDSIHLELPARALTSDCANLSQLSSNT